MPELPENIKPGLTHEREWIVEDSMLYAPGGDPARATLSSPSMINEMEVTAMLGLDHHLPNNGFTVGFHVDVKHIAPAPPGTRMKTTAQLKNINGNKFTFTVQAHNLDDNTLIGTGTHRRAAIFP